MTKAIELTAALMQRRDDMKRLMGANYKANSDLYRSVLRNVCADSGVDLAHAALDIGRKMDAKGIDPSMIFAAFVDESESGETR